MQQNPMTPEQANPQAPHDGQQSPPVEERRGLTPKGLIFWIAGGGATLILAIVGIFALVIPSAVPSGIGSSESAAAADKTAAGLETVADLYVELNTALQAQDREMFFSYVAGDAVAPLTLWWDNMDKFGWTNGGISTVEFEDEWLLPADNGPVTVDTIFGASMGYSAFSPRGSGSRDAGLYFIQGSDYQATIEDVDGLKITGWATGEVAAVWDIEELYVAKGELSVVAGVAADKDLIDATVASADAAARWVLDDFTSAGRELPLDGFNVFITSNEDQFSTWFIHSSTREWLMDVAGYAIPMQRPANSGAGVDPLLATGEGTSTSVVSIGPKAFDSLERVLAHEFVHVVHYTEASSSFANPPKVTIEGWARYQDKRFNNGGSFPSADDDISYCASGFLTQESTVPTTEQLRGADSWCYYELSASIYGYAAANGYDVYDLAQFSKAAAVDPIEASASIAPEGTDPLTTEGWVSWVQSNY